MIDGGKKDPSADFIDLICSLYYRRIVFRIQTHQYRVLQKKSNIQDKHIIE